MPGGPKDGVNPHIFPLAVRLGKGEKLALAPRFLDSLFRRLDESAENLTKSRGRYIVVSYGNTSFLQLILWKRFETLSPQAVEFEVLEMEEVVEMEEVEDDNRIIRSVLNKMLKIKAQRWSKLKQHKNKSLVKNIDSEKHFVFHPYTFTPRGVLEATLYAAPGGGSLDIFANEIPMNAMNWLAISSPTLLSFIYRIKNRNNMLQPAKGAESVGLCLVRHSSNRRDGYL